MYHSATSLAQDLYFWAQSATPEQQAAWAELSEPYNAMLADSPWMVDYETLSAEDQYEFWATLDDLFVG